LTFQASLYGETIEQIVALDGGGCRPMLLVCSGCSSAEAARAIQLAEWQLFFDYCARPRQ
jgi:hypothetical protein